MVSTKPMTSKESVAQFKQTIIDQIADKALIVVACERGQEIPTPVFEILREALRNSPHNCQPEIMSTRGIPDLKQAIENSKTDNTPTVWIYHTNEPVLTDYATDSSSYFHWQLDGNTILVNTNFIGKTLTVTPNVGGQRVVDVEAIKDVFYFSIGADSRTTTIILDKIITGDYADEYLQVREDVLQISQMRAIYGRF